MGCIFNQKIQQEVVLNDSSYGGLDWSSFISVGANQVKLGYYDAKNNYQYKIITLNLTCNKNN